MIGNTSASTERSLGKILASYLADPTNAFVISSDFAHWGLRFRYTHYHPSTGDATSLRSSSKTPTDPEIHESIKNVDFECIGACETGSHQAWLDVLSETGNTVCGRHPIGVVMAGLEAVKEGGGGGGSEGLFKFLCYERSGEVKQVSESSVSYASAFAVL
jgi:AmmeMemoRadiSam system protein B